jgi:histidine triad (HIT) family protein
MTCIFCKIAGGEIPSHLVYEDKDMVAFNDINPKAPIHVLIIPKRHIEKVSDLGPEDASLVGRLVVVARQIANERGISEKGFRLVFNCGPDAGQEVNHIHLHLLGGRAMNWPPG